MASNPISMPTGFGGLMRYNEEYHSKYRLEPMHVIVFVIILILFVIGLNLFSPVKIA